MQIFEAQQGVGVSPVQERHHEDGWGMQSHHVSVPFWNQTVPFWLTVPFLPPLPLPPSHSSPITQMAEGPIEILRNLTLKAGLILKPGYVVRQSYWELSQAKAQTLS